MDSEIIIVGAGVTGLALAQGLRRAGIPCVVFEKDHGFLARSRDWNMGLHWGAPALRKVIGEAAWESRIQSVQVDPNVPTKPLDHLSFLNAATGEAMMRAPIENFYRLKRSALRKLLAEGIDVRFGKHLEHLQYSTDGRCVRACFADGQSVTGRLVIGADGARSRVRELLFSRGGRDEANGHAIETTGGTVSNAADPRRMPFAATFVHASYTREQALFLRSFHPLFLAGIHPDNMFCFFGIQDVPLAAGHSRARADNKPYSSGTTNEVINEAIGIEHNGEHSNPETWTFFFYISWRSPIETQDETAYWTNSQRLAQVKKLARTFADPWRSAFEWLPDDHPVWHITFADWDPGEAAHRWNAHNGRVTLAGDAAHVMTYQRGQGLNHSITDGLKLVEAIQRARDDENASWEEVLCEYEKEMVERAGEEVRQCTKNTEMVHDWDKVLHSPVMQKGLNKE